MKRYTYFDGGKWRLKIDDTEYSGDWVDRLHELAQAKKEGRLVVLPCEIGSPVYSHARKLDGAIMMEQLCMMYECFDAVENRRRYKVRRLANRLKEAPACSK